MALKWADVANLTGSKGDKGDPGEPGTPGTKGDPGTDGADGRSIRLAAVDVMSNSDVAVSSITPSTGIAVDDIIVDTSGDAYTVTSVAADKVHVSNNVGGWNIKGPKGDKGEDGKGISIAGSVATQADLPANLTAADAGKAFLAKDSGLLYIWDGSAWGDGVQFKGDKGDKGEPGVTSATAVSLEPGATPTASVANGVLALGIPKGAQGAKGDPGAKGADGARGNVITASDQDPTGTANGKAGDMHFNSASKHLFIIVDDGA